MGQPWHETRERCTLGGTWTGSRKGTGAALEQLMLGKLFPIFSRHEQQESGLMPGLPKGKLTSRRAKRIYLLLFAFSILFFVCNDIILPWYVNQGGIVEVPSVLGVPYSDAVKSLAALGLEGRKGDVRLDKDHPAGLVIIQSPFPGEKVKRGRRVYITIIGGGQRDALSS